MSGSLTPARERDAQLLSIGHRCADPHCGLVDFLPFKCQHCAEQFCGEHFLPAAHRCAKYDERAHNRIAPPCPLCNTPVAIPPGQDPNVRMERHIHEECSVMTGKTGKKSLTCAKGKCGKVLYSPIRCEKCKQQYCPQHRFPATHDCSTTAPAPAPSSYGLNSKAARGAAAAAANVPAQGVAAMAAIKRSLAAGPSSSASASARAAPKPASPAKPIAASSSAANPPAKAPGSPRTTNPFSATDRSSLLCSISASAAAADAARSASTTAPASADDANKPPSLFDAMSYRPPPLFASA